METEDLRAALRTVGGRFKKTRASLKELTDELQPLVREALTNPDIKQREIVDLTGYTRERLRTLARDDEETGTGQ